MDKARALDVLKEMFRYQGELMAAYKRKKSWRPSEIAMSCADVMEKREAIAFAYKELSGGLNITSAPDKHAA